MICDDIDSATHCKYIDNAINVANDSELIQKHGAIVVSGGKIVSKAYNSYAPVYKFNGINNHKGSGHAEANALKEYYKNIRGNARRKNKYMLRSKIDIYVVRVNRLGELMNSKPCYHCTRMLKMLGIRRVYYSDNNGNIVCERVSELSNTHITGGNN